MKISKSSQRVPALNSSVFGAQRERLKKLFLKNSLAVLNANDVPPTNADGTLLMQPNSDLFYLTGIAQEETILLLAPDAFDERSREILFLRQPNPHLLTWEGHKLSKEEAQKISGIQRVEWLSAFPAEFHKLMCEVEHVCLNSNEHKRAAIEVESRDARFINECRRRYPLHDYQRLAPLMHQVRVAKLDEEIDMIRYASRITGQGFRRVLKKVKPGFGEYEVEAEFSYEFIRNQCGFAYPPIIASGADSCVLHYHDNNKICRSGDLLLMDVAAKYMNYNSDLTRTIPASGRFTRRQRQVYDAVLRVMRATMQAAKPGLLHRDWQKLAEQITQKELVNLGLLSMREIKQQDPASPALKKYFMHGVGHAIGLDVHDVGNMNVPMQNGWVMTCEPGIYITDEGFGVRIENTFVITDNGPVDLMADIPIEAEEIESLMRH